MAVLFPNKNNYLVLAGCTLLVMPIAVHMVFGNLLIYLQSYYHARRSSIMLPMDLLWAPTMFIIAQPLGIVLSELTSRYIQARKSMVVGVFFLSASVILSYKTMGQEPLGFILMFGAAQGIGGGFVTGLSFKLVGEVMPNYTELAFVITWVGPSFYSLLHMLMALYLINPANKQPDATDGTITYFTQEDVIDNVPPFFWKSGLLTLVFELAGLHLIQFQSDCISKTERNAEESGLSSKSIRSDDTNLRTMAGSSYKFPDYGSHANSQTVHETALCQDSDEGENKSKVNSMSSASRDNVTPELGQTSDVDPDGLDIATAGYTEKDAVNVLRNDTLPVCQDSTLSGSKTSKQNLQMLGSCDRDLSPIQVLSSRNFWKLWFVTLMMGHTFFIHTNLYKQYGLQDIHRDKLLTMSAVTGVALMIITMPVFGVFIPKYGLKIMFLILGALSNIFITLVPITLTRSHSMYILLVILQFCVIPSLAVFINLLPLILFGARHYSQNLGLLGTAYIVIYMLDSFLMPVFIHYAEWNVLYLTGTLSSTFGFFLCLALPRHDLDIK